MDRPEDEESLSASDRHAERGPTPLGDLLRGGRHGHLWLPLGPPNPLHLALGRGRFDAHGHPYRHRRDESLVRRLLDLPGGEA